jgi:hypothetical protein
MALSRESTPGGLATLAEGEEAEEEEGCAPGEVVAGEAAYPPPIDPAVAALGMPLGEKVKWLLTLLEDGEEEVVVVGV